MHAIFVAFVNSNKSCNSHQPYIRVSKNLINAVNSYIREYLVTPLKVTDQAIFHPIIKKSNEKMLGKYLLLI
jgi:hypothetical protein